MQQNNAPIQDEVPATPEEEQALEQAIDLAMIMIHDEGQAGDNIAAMVLQSQEITQGIGQAVATVIVGVEKKSPMDDAVKIALSEVVANELIELAIEAGALSDDESQDDDFIDEVVSQAYSQYLTIKESMGELDQGQLQSEVDEVKAAMGQGAQPQQPKSKPAGLLQQMRG